MTRDEMHEALEVLVATMETGRPDGGEGVCKAILADQGMSDRALPAALAEAIFELDGQDAPSTYGEGAQRVLAMLG